MIGHSRQPGEHVLQISMRIVVVALAGDDQRVDDRSAVASIGMTDEEPVLRAKFAWPDGVLNGVGVEAGVAVAQMRRERGSQ